MLWWGQMTLRSASDAQPSGVVVAPSLGIHSLSPPHELEPPPCWSSPERRTAQMERFLTCTRSSGISMWPVVWSDQRKVFSACVGL